MIKARKLGSFLIGGVVAQGFGAISGLLMANFLTTSDYAIYTIAMTMIGAIAVLTKGGVRMGLSAALARFWPDKERSSVAISSTIRTRFFISALTMPIVIIMSGVLMHRADAPVLLNVAIVGILIAVWWADMRSAVIDQLLFFDDQAVRVQVLDTLIAAGRMVALGALWLLNILSIMSVLLVHFLSVAVRIPFIQKWVHRALDHIRADPDPEVTGSVRTVALRQVPVDIFGVAQAQVAMFFLTQGGGTFELATYGALGRFAQLVAPAAAVSVAFFVPAFARTNDRVIFRMSMFVLFGSIPAFAFILIALVQPQAMLFLIGSSYSSQAQALLVFSLTTTVINAVQIAWSLSSHRGWNKWAWLRIPIGIAWCFIAPFVLEVHTASGAFIFYAGFSVGTAISIAVDLVSARRRGEIRLFGRADHADVAEENAPASTAEPLPADPPPTRNES